MTQLMPVEKQASESGKAGTNGVIASLKGSSQQTPLRRRKDIAM